MVNPAWCKTEQGKGRPPDQNPRVIVASRLRDLASSEVGREMVTALRSSEGTESGLQGSGPYPRDELGLTCHGQRITPSVASPARLLPFMKTYFLHLESSDDVLPATNRHPILLRIIDPPDGAINQRFYRAVGGDWSWTDCAEWTAARWQEYLEARPITTVVLELEGEEIGYGEMINREGDVEILSFGLLQEFIGRGLGGSALEVVSRYAWTLGAVHHVWLHTCDNDHPNALRNYERRGFTLYQTEED